MGKKIRITVRHVKQFPYFCTSFVSPERKDVNSKQLFMETNVGKFSEEGKSSCDFPLVRALGEDEKLNLFNNPDFGNIRILMDKSGKPWFVANDAARCLGYADPNNAIRRLVKPKHTLLLQLSDSQDCNGTPCDSTGLGNQAVRQIKILDEPGFYALAFSSKLDSAERFRDWVMEEVLPSIRSQGYYGKKPAVVLPDFNDPVEAARAWADEVEKRRLVEKAKEQAENERDTAVKTLVEQQPVVDAMNDMVPEKGIYVRELVKYMENFGYITSGQEVRKLLHELKFIFMNPFGRWEPYQGARDRGYVGLAHDYGDEFNNAKMATPVILKKGFVKLERAWKSEKWRPVFLRHGKEKIDYDD